MRSTDPLARRHSTPERTLDERLARGDRDPRGHRREPGATGGPLEGRAATAHRGGGAGLVPGRDATTTTREGAGRQAQSAEGRARGARSAPDRHPGSAPQGQVHHAGRSAPGAGPPRRLPERADKRHGAPSTVLRLQGGLLGDHHFYDQLCPECAAFNFAKRGELADLSGPGRAGDRRPGQDRLSGGSQTAALRRPPDRLHPVPAGRRRALLEGARLRRLVGPAGDLRPRSAARPERRSSLPGARWARRERSTI